MALLAALVVATAITAATGHRQPQPAEPALGALAAELVPTDPWGSRH